jgi:hypothetical protein
MAHKSHAAASVRCKQGTSGDPSCQYRTLETRLALEEDKKVPLMISIWPRSKVGSEFNHQQVIAVLGDSGTKVTDFRLPRNEKKFSLLSKLV